MHSHICSSARDLSIIDISLESLDLLNSNSIFRAKLNVGLNNFLKMLSNIEHVLSGI